MKNKMLSKNKIKEIKKLENKKYRDLYNLFLVSGKKSVQELINSDFTIEEVFITEDFYNQNIELFSKNNSFAYSIVENGEIEKISYHQNPEGALAIARIKKNKMIVFEQDLRTRSQIIIALDGLKDPGNLGTIIRIADWYGIKNIIASPETVDFYNPKVISASMGSFTRINFFETDLEKTLFDLKSKQIDIIGSFPNKQKNVTELHNFTFPFNGVLVIGNESHGISENLIHLIKHNITIGQPRLSINNDQNNSSANRYEHKYEQKNTNANRPESLNAAIACAIIIDKWFFQS